MSSQRPLVPETAKPNACQFCKQNYACGVLKTAMEILERDLREENQQELYRKFLELKSRLEKAGYHYPDSENQCALADQPEHLAKLIGQAQDYCSDCFKSQVKVSLEAEPGAPSKK